MYKIETTIKKIVEMKGDFVVSLAPVYKFANENFLILLNKEGIDSRNLKAQSEASKEKLINFFKIFQDRENNFLVCSLIVDSVKEIFNNSKKAIFYLEDKPEVGCKKELCEYFKEKKCTIKCKECIGATSLEDVNKELIIVGVEMANE